MFDEAPDASALAPDSALLDRAARLAIERRSASVVLFQIKLSIGYHRARALIGRLVEEGVIGPMGDAGSHPILVTEEAWEAKRASIA